MHDGPLDYILFIVLLVAVSAVTFNLVVPQVNESREMYYSNTYDKTVSNLNGETALSYEDVKKSIKDSSMTYDKIAVMIANQDDYIISVNNEDAIDKTVYINIGLNKIAVGNSGDNANIDSILLDMQEWFNSFKSSSSYNCLYNPPEKYDSEDALYQVRYSSIGTGALDKTGQTIEPCYSIFIYGVLLKDYNAGNVYGQLFRCMADGTLTTVEGDLVK